MTTQPILVVAFRPIENAPTGAALDIAAFEGVRRRLIRQAKAAGVEALEANSFWYPQDKTVPLVFFEFGPRVLVGSESDRVAEMFIVQSEGPDAWVYSSHAITRPHPGESYDQTRTDMTADELEVVFMAWLEATRRQAETPAPSTIHLPSITSATRRRSISNQQAHQIRASLERPLELVEAELQAGRLPEPVEHDLRLLIQQLHHWSNMLEPTTQGFEHILAEITRRIVDNTTEPHSMRHRLIHLGADPTTAAAIDASIRDTLNTVTSLGSDDDHVDGEQLSELARQVSRLEDGLQQAIESAPPDSELAQSIKRGAGTEAGVRAVGALVQAVVSNWDKIRVGLALAWKSISNLLLEG